MEKIAYRRAVYSPCQIVAVEEESSLKPECLLEGDYPQDQVYLTRA